MSFGIEQYNSVRSSFTNPFMSVSTKWMPRSMREMLDLCEWMYLYNSTYRSAIDRIARLFYTFPAFDSSENIRGSEPYKKFFKDNIKFKQRLITIGKDFLAYGNSFLCVHLPFKRMIKCPVCNNTYPASAVELDYSPDGHFTGKCVCGATPTKFGYRDVPLKDLSKVNIIRFSPKEMEVYTNKISGTSVYYWKIGPTDRRKIRMGKGTPLISDTPVEILQAVFLNKKVRFDDTEMLHLKDESLAGLDMDWGTPFALSCFPLVFYIAVLRKANEAISMDYIVPLRIIFPQSTTSNQEAGYMNLGNFVANIKGILRHHKHDPDDYHVTPVPVGYQTIGGEKRSLMISDDIKLSNDELLNSMGFPAELFYGTLALQAAPMALRLLENTFDLTSVYNTIIRWTFRKTSSWMGMGEANVELTPLKLADDMERRNMIANLSAAQKISDISMLEMYNLDFEKEQKRKLEQIKIISKLQEEDEKSKEIDQQMSGDGSGGEGPSTPSAIMQSAGDTAQQLLMMPESMRRSELDTLLKTNPLLHHAVRAEMESQRGKMGTQGAAMIQQQMAQEQGGVQ